jgi:GrpB-like predicted nucleotidyltransferase (UPF0157 family)
MIGLKKGTVQVIPHHASWRDAFAQERRVLHELIGGHVLDIQHVGSTAVPGLDAKPIIDSAVAVASAAQIAERRQPLRLKDLGYVDRGDSGTEGGYLFVKESAPEVRTHHRHMLATAALGAQVQGRRGSPRHPQGHGFMTAMRTKASQSTQASNL